MKINPVNAHIQHYREVQTRSAKSTREDKKRDDRVKTVQADNILSKQTLIYKKEFDVIWLIKHSRIGGSVDQKA